MSIIQPSLSRDAGRRRGGISFKQYMRRYGTLYLLLLPIIFFILFRYAPMAYILSAFKKNNIIRPPWEVAWARNNGFEWFIKDRDFLCYWVSASSTRALKPSLWTASSPSP